MDGLLVIDKPSGLTSHEVVTCVRRALAERRIGHTGTLDPAATGVLVLVLGRATRLAQFLSRDDKSYEAVVRFGTATDTYDADGTIVQQGTSDAIPGSHAIEQALEGFRGTFLQEPPAFSAKKVNGTRSYRVARRARRDAAAQSTLGPDHAAPSSAAMVRPSPVAVTAHAIEILRCDGDTVTLRVDCSAGFYVRSLAHDLGMRLGVPAHLVALRRTSSGGLTLEDAVPFDLVVRAPDSARTRVVPLGRMLSDWRAITLTSEGLRRAVHGQTVRPCDAADVAGAAHGRFVRLLDAAGDLVGIARPAPEAPGSLHPSVVLK